MSLLSNIVNGTKKTYEANVKCTNCLKVQVAPIQKGVTVEQFIKEGLGVCQECGCTTLEKISSKSNSGIILEKEKNIFNATRR